jgi:hypothetical protein
MTAPLAVFLVVATFFVGVVVYVLWEGRPRPSEPPETQTDWHDLGTTDTAGPGPADADKTHKGSA